MTRLPLYGAVALLLLLWSGGAMAQDTVINGRFELPGGAYWAVSGTSTLQGFEQYDTSKDALINGNFEIAGGAQWFASGTTGGLYGFEQYDVTGTGISESWRTQSWNDGTAYTNSIIEWIPVTSGMLYNVSADFAYDNC